jgi:hypothetical protein
MWHDPTDGDAPEIYTAAIDAFQKAQRTLSAEKTYIDITSRCRNTEQELLVTGLDGLEHREGFYDLANNHGENTLFIVTQDALPFACASLIAGHAQRTE